MAPGSEAQLAIREGREGPLAGDLYLARTSSAPWSVEIGITLTPGSQGRGLATAAITAVVDAVFGAVLVGGPVHRLVAGLDVDNLRSRALFERLGFRLEAHHVRSGRRRDGTFADELLFAITDQDWRRRTTTYLVSEAALTTGLGRSFAPGEPNFPPRSAIVSAGAPMIIVVEGTSGAGKTTRWPSTRAALAAGAGPGTGGGSRYIPAGQLAPKQSTTRLETYR